MTTYIVLLMIAAGIYFAIRSLKKQKGCSRGCASCSKQGCPAKAIQQLASESKRRRQ